MMTEPSKVNTAKLVTSPAITTNGRRRAAGPSSPPEAVSTTGRMGRTQGDSPVMTPEISPSRTITGRFGAEDR